MGKSQFVRCALGSDYSFFKCDQYQFWLELHKDIYRVSNRKGRSMQNEFVSVVSNRPTLGKIETTPQIGYALGNVRENAILNHKPKYKKMAT